MNFQILAKMEGGDGKLSPHNQMPRLRRQKPKSRTSQPLLLAFGALLKWLHARFEKQRGRGFSHDALAIQVTARLKKLGPHLSISGSTIHRWEAGQVWSVDPLALRELAAIYGTTFTVLTAVLLKNMEQPDLPEHDGLRLFEDAIHAAPPPSPDSLHHLLGRYETIIETARQLIGTAEGLEKLAAGILHEALGGQAAITGHPPTGSDASDRAIS